MLSSIGSPIFSLNSLLRHPVFLIATAGIAVRLLIFPFAEVGYDADCWAVIIRNLESGQGLYRLEGYYYTPVWGYSLSFQSVMQELFLHIDVMGRRVPEAFPVETYSVWWSANATSVTFNFFLKIPFLISDLIVGYLIYWLIKDLTKDMKKAVIGFALWFLSPLVICVTSISGMFDTFSVLFALLCVIMVRKDKLFLGGVLFVFAVLTKFFPIYLIFILLAYIIVKHRDDGKALRSVIIAAAGALTAFFVLMAPQIAGGELSESFLFLTSRATNENHFGSFADILLNPAVIAGAAGIAVSAILGYLLTKKSKETLDGSFFKYALLIMLSVFISPGLPQYLVLLIPFLAIYTVTADSRFKWCWLLVSVGGTMFIIARYFDLFLSLGAFTDIVSLDRIISLAEWSNTPIFFGHSLISLSFAVSAAAACGILLGMALFVVEWYDRGRRGEDVFGSAFFSSVFRFSFRSSRMR